MNFLGRKYNSVPGKTKVHNGETYVCYECTTSFPEYQVLWLHPKTNGLFDDNMNDARDKRRVYKVTLMVVDNENQSEEDVMYCLQNVKYVYTKVISHESVVVDEDDYSSPEYKKLFPD